MSSKKPRLEPQFMSHPGLSAPKKNKPQKGKKKIPLPLVFIKWALILSLWGGVFIGILCVWFGYDLPDIKRLEASTRRPGISFLARDGTLIATYGDLYGKHVHVKDLPPYIIHALLATEDRRFYEHFGLDIIGIGRALWQNYRHGSVVQGGSTLTQQLAKNFLLTEKLFSVNDRSLRRKVQELMLALWLESKFTKDQILSIYLNRVYLGSGVYGLEAAALKYFQKHAKHLNLYEAAVIAGLLKAPSKYSPLTHPKAAEERARVVLDNMVAAGYLSEEEANTLHISAKEIERQQHGAYIGRYFTDWLMTLLPDLIGNLDQDLIVKTTLDLHLQTLAEQKTKDIIHTHGKEKRASQAALVAMTPDGGVRALVGGIDYTKSPFNRAVQAKRQTGSAFKLFIYLAALEFGYHADSIVSDLPIQFGKWRPKNDHWETRGSLSLEQALAYSVNTTAVRLMAQIGPQTIASVAKRLGILSPQPQNLTMALGSGEASLLELASAYTTILNHGFGVWPYGILEIHTKEGEGIYRREPSPPRRLIERPYVLELLHMLKATIQYGTGKKAYINRPCAGKTGTTQSYKDAWFMGFTADLMTGVWVGNDDGSLMKKVSGSGLPALFWHNFMAEAHAHLPPKDFPS